MQSLRSALDQLATENSQLRSKVGLAPEEKEDSTMADSTSASERDRSEDPPAIVQSFVEGYGTLRGWLLGRDEEEALRELPPLPPLPPSPRDESDGASVSLSLVAASSSVAGSGTSTASWEKPEAAESTVPLV